jgi:lipopolysaccharide biosynthesis protein
MDFVSDQLKLLAFYLPQFHPIPENDQWWGKGFTEWNNVTSSVPGFTGHIQPRVPAKPLEYYDLRSERVQSMQAAMAKRYGLYGFCYYYYWFGGKKLLETPLENMLGSGKPNFPFCICWANHEWTRAWYGQDKKILIAQDYSKSSMKKFILDLIPALKDPRYITIEDRPVVCVHQAEDLPDSKAITDLWRKEAGKHGIELYLVKVEAFCWGYTPAELGFDAAVEFAPDWRMTGDLLAPGVKPRRVDYRKTIINMLNKPKPEYKLFRGVFPQWDNTPRYKSAAFVFDKSSPEAFSFHLQKTLRYTVENFPEEERFIFINAWNEWGEGCYLEPCESYGYAYLDAVKYALSIY